MITDDTLANNPLLNGSYEVTDCAVGIAVTSITSAGKLGIMGTLVDLGTSGAGTMERKTFTFGQVAVPGNPLSYLRLAWTTAATAGTPKFTHKIADVETFSGRKCTLQGWYRSNAAIGFKLRQDFGTGGSPTADVSTNPGGPTNTIPSTVDATGTAQWRPFALTFSLPSITGLTKGSTVNTSYLGVDFLPLLNTIFQSDFAALKLVPEGLATALVQHRDFATEERLLGRFYQTFSQYVNSGVSNFNFPLGRMAAAPTVSGNLAASVAGTPTVDGAYGTHTGTSGLVTGVTADARIAD